MTEKISFEGDISALKQRLEEAKEELAELEERWRAYDLKTQECRQSLRGLRQTLRGELPDEERELLHGDLQAVPVNPDTGRPARGARRRQIELICQRVGRSQETFRTIDVLRVLEEVEGELTDGMKSYTYAVMSDLEDEGLVEKIGRGRWKLDR
ncbi:MAG: hypothetical protein ACOCV2_00605 [Persicimonas sp.]